MKRMSEICWEAANEHLRHGDIGITRFSCIAVGLAGGDEGLYAETVGVNPAISAIREVDWSDEKTQGARYMLLLFASYYFEDIGQ